MGKKRRYIHRVKKFGTKMFKFLDKVDGTADSILSASEIDNIIERVTVADRGNRTISITSRALGADFTLEKMHYQVNELTEDTDIACDAGGTGPDKFTFPSAIPAVDGANGLILLAAGQHKVTAELTGGTENAPLVTKTFDISEAKKDLSAVTSEDADNGQIQVNVAAGIDLAVAPTAGAAGEAAGRLPGEESFTLGNDGTKNDLLVSLVDKDGAAVAIKAVTGCNTTADDNVRSTIAKGASFKFQGKAGALPGAGSPYVLTITPRSVGGTAHAPSAITITQPVADITE